MPRSLPLAVAAALLLLAACGSDGAKGQPDRTTEGEVAQDPPAASPAPARTAASRSVRLVSIGRFSAPLAVVAAPGDRRRVYVVEQGGKVWVVRGGRRLAQPFVDLSSQVLAGGEQGLLSIVFAPDFAQSRLVYAYFTGRDGRQNIVELRAPTGDRADSGTQRLVLRMDDPEANHNGGQMLFGPDGHLYVGTGDGGGGNDQHGGRGNAQDLGSLLGKILRIDPKASGGRRYTVPADNPFAGRSGARAEIYSYGLRNPWRFSFDRSTGDLSIGDVGQDAVEEIDFVRRGRGAGANFGWRPFEGRTRLFDERAPGHVPPVITHTHAAGWCSITGGVVVRDRGVPGLYGRYVYGDFCAGRLMSARLRAGRTASPRPVGRLSVPGTSSFGEDAQGRVYVTSSEGPVYRLAAGR